MFRALVLFLILPWWAYFGLAAGTVYLGEMSYKSALETQAKRAAAREAGPPPVVDLSDFDEETDKSDIREINVRGWIDTEFNYELVETKNGVAKTTRYMFMLFGERDPAGSSVVRAAMVLNEKNRDRFVENIGDFMVDFGGNGLVFQFNGYASGYVTLADLAADAIEKKGLRKADDFIYIEPFFDGREVTLAPRGAPESARKSGRTIAGVIALFGVFRFLRRRKAKPAKPVADSFADGPIAGVGAQPSAQPSVPLAKAITPDSPLERLAAKRASGQAAADPFAVPSPDAAALVARDSAETAAPDPFARDAAPQPHRVTPRRPAHRDGLTHRRERPAQPEGAVQDGLTPGFVAKLVLAMLVVGTLAYDPGMVARFAPMIGPFAMIFVFYAGVFKLWGKAKALLSGVAPTRAARGQEVI